jgi:adenosylmethionine-8-amino-7-oxononanoate aminotransferase
MLRDKNSEIAAIILEPLVLAAGGMIIYPAEYLKRTAALAKRYNVHLILDEVATGFGRTGRMFACEHTDAKPDFICLSKGITAGFLPLAATLTTDAIYKAFYADYKKRKTFYHGHTYTANPISCSAAIASLEVFRKENVLKKIEGLIPLFNKRLQDFRDLAFVGDVRHIGMIGAIELVKDKAIKTAFGFNERIGLRVYAEALKEQLILRPLGNIIYFYLPLCIKKNELAHVLKKAYKVIKNLPNLI